MTPNQEKLVSLLKDMFQFDQADLDFGIYRIMNLKRNEINDYLERSLIPQISEGLQSLANIGNEQQIREIETQIASTKAMPISEAMKTTIIAELEAKKKNLSGTNIADIEGDVYTHLINFFSRYYDEGDFISQRRYKDGVYAIPYEGEEVKLYWANADQYYVKTSEYFTDYSFTTSFGKKVHFKLVDAKVEKDNIKSTDKKFFILAGEKQYEIDGEELTVYFEYTKGEKKQEEYNKLAASFVKESLGSNLDWMYLFVEPKKGEKCEFEKQLYRYTARNTFDYFIHKNLKKFLLRELDFYIKNEVVYLDDISVEDMNKTKEYLVKAQTIKAVASKIIEFLAQIENFQKKMYLKKKLVVSTNYCITLDRISEEFYAEIIANEAQREEWVKLFAIDEIKEEDGNLLSEDKVGYSAPLTVEFLKQNPFLVLDTKFFSEEFKQKLIESIDNLDESLNGLLIHSENFQALNLLQSRYKQQIKCCYIDPPFNLGQNGDFLYKTDYKDSTWTTILHNRLNISKKLLSDDGMQFIRCDINGNFLVRMLGEEIFGKDNFSSEILVQRIRKNVTEQGRITIPLANDSLFLFFNSPNSVFNNPFKKLNAVREKYWRRIDDSAGYRNPPERMIFGALFKPYKTDAHFKFSQERMDQMVLDKKIRLVCKSCKYEHYQGVWTKCPKCGSIDSTPQYLVEETDSIVLDTNWLDIPGYSSNWGFSTENSVALLERTIDLSANKNDIVMDYFGGSGTTAHAIISLNRNGCNRKFILCEMGEQFHTIIIPRIEKVSYSEDWRDNKPISRKGISQAFKYLRLEGYEDTLNNIKFDNKLDIDSTVSEEYLLKYMLENESEGSVFNVDSFAKPFDYYMSITEKQEAKTTKIDLVESFNYLIGLVVERNYAISSYDADFETGEYGAVSAKLKKGNMYRIKLVEGHTLSGEKILIIWRELTGDIVKDNAVLDAILAKKKISSTDFEYDKIFVNGDNNLQNLSKDENEYKVALIEDEFQKRMFENE